MTNHPSDAWQVGDNVIVRAESWTVLGVTAFSDCTALRLEGAGTSNARRVRTLLLPFDRPVRGRPRGLLRVVRGARWLHELRRLSLRAHAFGALRTAASSRIRLLPYQLEPALAVCRHGVSRVLIADDVGLGKTIQAGLIVVELAALADAFRALVLAPAGLIPQWSRELRDHFGISATIADATWLRAAGRAMPSDVNPWSLEGVYLASIDFSKRAEVLNSIEDLLWDVVVVDEAHGAGPGTDRRQAVNAIARRARHVVLLTATPDNGEPGRMDDLCRLGSEDELEPITVFRRLRGEVANALPRRTRFLAVRPTDRERQMHRLLERYTRRLWTEGMARGDPRARLVSIVLRKRALSSAASLATSAQRRLDIVGSSMPDPSARQLRLPMDGEELLEDAEPDAVLGAPGLEDAARERRWLAAIVEAAACAARHESKATRLVRLMSIMREPVIVFTEYRDTLARLARLLSGHGLEVVSIHGGMTALERDAVVRRFNEECLWLLATDAAADGLNLQAQCRIVIHYELPWSPARLEQRCGRVDRMGQTRRVHEIALVANDTAEHMVLAPLGRRIARAWGAAGTNQLHRCLSESRVAAALVGGAALHMDAGEPTARASEPVRDMTLRAEAVLECRRLLDVRRFIQLSVHDRAGPPQDDMITVSLVRGLARSRRTRVVLIYALVLTAGARIVHSEILPVCVATPSGVFPITPQGLREHIRACRAALEAATAAAVQKMCASRLASIGPAYAVMLGQRARRERAIVSSRPSSASQLVQAGLFDRRATQTAAARVSSDPRAEDVRIPAVDTPLGCTAELRAILVVDGQRCGREG
ncbi:MAG: DEAD/DEAH box helicase [Acidobacteria bacterium]|nr:DEAD/DEAH box helicase [Acidobacteriota bacterium]MCA1651304.1 DEAD/DEAH box helicase [Acidobacteriota bacterium]